MSILYTWRSRWRIRERYFFFLVYSRLRLSPLLMTRVIMVEFRLWRTCPKTTSEVGNLPTTTRNNGEVSVVRLNDEGSLGNKGLCRLESQNRLIWTAKMSLPPTLAYRLFMNIIYLIIWLLYNNVSFRLKIIKT